MVLQIGYLLVQTFTSQESFGEKDVRISLSGGQTLFTDENGFTPKIEIEAPDKALSESPGNVSPYTLVDLTIEKEGFFTIIIRNVQIFAEETTLQKIQMLPIPENGGSGTIEYNLPQQNL